MMKYNISVRMRFSLTQAAYFILSSFFADILIDLSTSFLILEYILILIVVLSGSMASSSLVELLLCVTLLK